MSASFISVFIASLLGSPHCAGMCGGFVAFYSGKAKSRFTSHVAYNFGRLLTYSALGFAAGYLGKNLNNVGALVGFQRTAAIATGCLLIFWGVRALIGGSANLKFDTSSSRFFRWLSSFFHRALKDNDSANWTFRAFVIGALSTFLPCGWLYMFAAVAAGTGDPVSGAAVMAAFWLGTVPVLATIGGLTRVLTSKLRVHVPKLTAALLLLAGFFSIFGHYHLIPGMHQGHGSHHATHHEHSAEH